MPFDGHNFVIPGSKSAEKTRWWQRFLSFVQQPEMDEPPRSFQLLVEARNLIADEALWIQGSYEFSQPNRKLRRCAVGALRAALRKRPSFTHHDFCEAYDQLRAITRQLDPTCGGGLCVERYNDHHTHGQVMRLFNLSISCGVRSSLFA